MKVSPARQILAHSRKMFYKRHMEKITCAVCLGLTSGYKCAMCGEESASRDPGHACGGEHCIPKCVDCNQAEARCVCE